MLFNQLLDLNKVLKARKLLSTFKYYVAIIDIHYILNYQKPIKQTVYEKK